MKCPACHRGLSKLEVQGVTVDICQEGCKGVWFDKGELEQVDEPAEMAGKTLVDATHAWSPALPSDKKRACPRDGADMAKISFKTKNNFEIDECSKCGGVWLDANELARLRGAFKTEKDRRDAALRPKSPADPPAKGAPTTEDLIFSTKFQRVFDLASGGFLGES